MELESGAPRQGLAPLQLAGEVTLGTTLPQADTLGVGRKSPGSQYVLPARGKPAGTPAQQMVSLTCCAGAEVGIWAKNVQTSVPWTPPGGLLEEVVRDSLWDCPSSLPGLCAQGPTFTPSSAFFFFTLTFPLMLLYLILTHQNILSFLQMF